MKGAMPLKLPELEFLGVILDENIYLESSHRFVRKQNIKKISFYYKKTKHLNVTSPKSICLSYVHLYMNYANIEWVST